jgi:hypothetical protein
VVMAIGVCSKKVDRNVTTGGRPVQSPTCRGQVDWLRTCY